MAFVDWSRDEFTLTCWLPNNADQVFMADLSMVYFAVDLVLDIMHGQVDLLFILHHVLSSSTMYIMSHVMDRGAAWLSKSGALGEVTNLLQILWIGSKPLGYMSLHNALGAPYTYLFVAIRATLFPVLYVSYVHETYFTAIVPPLPHPWLVVYMTFCGLLLVVGSAVWVC